MSDDSTYVFKDHFGKTQSVSGSPEAITALTVVFVRRDALNFTLAEIVKMVELVKPDSKA